MMKKSRSNSKIIYTIISILLSAIFIFQVPIQEPVIAYALDVNVPQCHQP